MALNEDEKNACRYYMGYPQIAVAASISFGVPDLSQLNFIMETNMNNVLPKAEARVRRCLQELECTEEQLSKFRPNLELRGVVGSVQFAGQDGMDALERQTVQWTARLADALGAPVNPFSNHLNHAGYGPTGVIEPT